ncbi:hypothetical protein CHS0354_020224 [Potamilus streckersoni]|uniref:Uncharacterized protein n=1 Tax=Potamilus streckersoni TaxID=2493646 RepID=A0AAE0VXC9_9BIVA|nr:hypothetical protein CHS0354_020224 [Potamilus streckersoni]
MANRGTIREANYKQQLFWRSARCHRENHVTITRPRHHQASETGQCPSHPQLRQCRLRHGPLHLGQQGANNNQEDAPRQYKWFPRINTCCANKPEKTQQFIRKQQSDS